MRKHPGSPRPPGQVCSLAAPTRVVGFNGAKLLPISDSVQESAQDSPHVLNMLPHVASTGLPAVYRPGYSLHCF